MIYLEFVEFGIDAEEWLYERYGEIRKLSKSWLKTNNSPDSQWFDNIVTLD
jgi:hypothetical protein